MGPCLLNNMIIPQSHSLPDVLLEKMMKYGPKIALVDGLTGLQVTYGELCGRILHLAGALYEEGLRQNDVVLLCCPNCLDYPVITLAVMYIGAIISPINPSLTTGDVAELLATSRPKIVVTAGGATYHKIRSALQQSQLSNKLTMIFIIGSDPSPAGCSHLNNLVREKYRAPPCVHFDVTHQVAALPYSSGTTGLPKGVMLTHYNILSNLYQFSNSAFRTPLDASPCGDTMIGVLPFFHCFGMTIVLLYTLFKGNKLVILPKFQFEVFLKTIEKYKVTFVYLVPPIALLLAKSPLVGKFDLSSVTSIFSGAAPLGQELCEELKQRLKVTDIRQGYGLTETSPGALHPPLGHTKYASVGIPLPNTEVKIVEPESQQSVGAHKYGELWIRGPQVMKGYRFNDAATREILDADGWLHSGDIGYYDEDGYFFIVDRIKEIIKYKGFQVPPAELESLLLTHICIYDAAVIGLPLEGIGELPKAYVVLKPNKKVTEEDVINFVSDRVAPYKKLRGGVEFVKSIPKSPSGKILRRYLREEAKRKSNL